MEFKNMDAKLGKIQQKFHHDYHKDVFVKGRLVTATDIPDIARALKEKVLQTSHEATQRVAVLLPDKAQKESSN